jgi:hypothetical protein
VVLISGCETVSAPPEEAAPTAQLALGDWTHAPAATTLAQFQSQVAARYAAGSPISAATADLQSNAFTCAADNDTTGRGAPPAQICRKTVTGDNCTGTWQVHLFDNSGNGQLAHARALFDKRCGREGLLGGPG